MGMLQSGDVLLAVNGESLENATLRDAVGMLRNAGEIVTLTVSKESGKSFTNTCTVHVHACSHVHVHVHAQCT